MVESVYYATKEGYKQETLASSENPKATNNTESFVVEKW